MNDVILRIQNISKQYDTKGLSGIDNLSFEIQRGNITSIIGQSGSGKSTLLKTIYGLLKPDAGTVFYNEKRVKGPDEQLIPGHPDMKMVTQDFALNIYAKVYDNIASMLPNTDLKAKQEKTLEAMRHLRIDHLKDKRVIDLSGGEQQRVAIAKSLVSNTKVLLLDEPFSQIDSLLKNQLRTDLKLLAQQTGLTIILVSHDATDGLFMSDQLLILKDGKLIQNDTPKQVYENPVDLYTAKILGNANVLEASDAALIGIKADQQTVVFYPEWVHLNGGNGGQPFTVKEVFFKGFYEELLLERDGVMVRALQINGIHKKNDQVLVNISRFLVF